jgi:hypothetical protein
MFRDLYRSRPHLGMIYVAMKSLRSPKLLCGSCRTIRPTAAGN